MGLSVVREARHLLRRGASILEKEARCRCVCPQHLILTRHLHYAQAQGNVVSSTRRSSSKSRKLCRCCCLPQVPRLSSSFLLLPHHHPPALMPYHTAIGHLHIPLERNAAVRPLASHSPWSTTRSSGASSTSPRRCSSKRRLRRGKPLLQRAIALAKEAATGVPARAVPTMLTQFPRRRA